MNIENKFPRHNSRISGDEVQQPTPSARIFVKADMRIAGPTSLNT